MISVRWSDYKDVDDYVDDDDELYIDCELQWRYSGLAS
jgi:hypothetical protein